MIYAYLADIGLTRKNNFIKSDNFELTIYEIQKLKGSIIHGFDKTFKKYLKDKFNLKNIDISSKNNSYKNLEKLDNSLAVNLFLGKTQEKKTKEINSNADIRDICYENSKLAKKNIQKLLISKKLKTNLAPYMLIRFSDLDTFNGLARLYEFINSLEDKNIVAKSPVAALGRGNIFYKINSIDDIIYFKKLLQQRFLPKYSNLSKSIISIESIKNYTFKAKDRGNYTILKELDLENLYQSNRYLIIFRKSDNPQNDVETYIYPVYKQFRKNQNDHDSREGWGCMYYLMDKLEVQTVDDKHHTHKFNKYNNSKYKVYEKNHFSQKDIIPRHVEESYRNSIIEVFSTLSLELLNYNEYIQNTNEINIGKDQIAEENKIPIYISSENLLQNFEKSFSYIKNHFKPAKYENISEEWRKDILFLIEAAITSMGTWCGNEIDKSRKAKCLFSIWKYLLNNEIIHTPNDLFKDFMNLVFATRGIFSCSSTIPNSARKVIEIIKNEEEMLTAPEELKSIKQNIKDTPTLIDLKRMFNIHGKSDIYNIIQRKFGHVNFNNNIQIISDRSDG